MRPHLQLRRRSDSKFERGWGLWCLLVVSGCGAERCEAVTRGKASTEDTSGHVAKTASSVANDGSGAAQLGESADVAKGSGMPQACPGGRCALAWPLAGSAGRDWIVSNYVDRLVGTGLRDYRGGTRTYEGHQGVDIAIASFRVMDQGVVARAVAPGIVTAVHDGEPDRNMVVDSTSCQLVANAVHVRHSDGLEGRYLHFRKGSLKVVVGQQIRAGDELGLVGSSGCSESPHLHFELRDPQQGNAILDPFFEERWAFPPGYDVAPSVMEVVFQSGAFTATNDVQAARANPTSVASGTVGFSVITGGTFPGRKLSVRLYESNALEVTLSPYEYVGTEDHYMRWWNPELNAGNWRAEISIGDRVVDDVTFRVW